MNPEDFDLPVMFEISSLPRSTGTVDDDDDPDDENEAENEPPVRETDDATEAPEEFEYDDEDEPPHAQNDDADLDYDEPDEKDSGE